MAHKWKSVCVHAWTSKIYQVEGTVLVSVRVFFQQNEHISVKKMKCMDHVQSCQLFLEYWMR